MKNKLLLRFFALFAVVLLFAWLALRSDPAGSTGGRRDRFDPGVTPGAIASGSGGDSLRLPDARIEPPREGDPLPVARRKMGARSPEASTNRIWISGRVRLPAEMPTDCGGAEITARGRHFASARNPAIRAREHTGRLQEDATFRVAFAERTRKGWLDLRGRYLYLPEEYRIDTGDIPVDLVLEPALGGVVSGTVTPPPEIEWTRELGEQVRVRLMGRGSNGRILRAARLDWGGRFEFTGVPPGSSYRLLIQSELWRDLDRGGIVVAAGELTAIAGALSLQEGNSIGGVVFWPDGSPASGAWVCLNPRRLGAYSNLEDAAEAVEGTDAGGAFRFRGLQAGPYLVQAHSRWILPEDRARHEAKQRDGKRSVLRRRGPFHVARIESVVSGTAALQLVLRQEENVTGRVVDDAGEPLAQYLISATPVPENPDLFHPDDIISRFVVNADGEFTLDGLPAGEWKLSASAAGFDRSSEALVSSPGTTHVELTASRLARVSGSVRDSWGRPVSAATVWIMNESEARNYTFLDYRHSRAAATTDDAGRFEVREVSPGRKAISAGSEGFERSEPVEVELECGSVVAGIDLQLRDGGAITGEVHAAVGPVADRAIQLSGRDFASSASTKSDPGGRFELTGLRPGRYRVSLRSLPASGQAARRGAARGGEDAVEVIRIEKGQTVHLVLGAPPENPVRVRGIVRIEGEPFPGAEMRVRCHRNPWLETPSTRADAAGAYALVLPEPGSYRFEVGGAAGDALDVEVTVPDLEVFELDFDVPTATLAGVVRNPDGSGRAGCTLQLVLVKAVEEESAAEDQRLAMTDGTGGYGFKHLRAGTYVLRVSPFSNSDRRRPGGMVLGSTLLEGLELSGGESRSGVDVDLEPSGRILGTAVGVDGLPVAGVTILVYTESGTMLRTWTQSHSDASGRFSYEGVAPGRYLVGGHGTDVRARRVPVRVYSEEDAEVELLVE